MNTIRAWSVWVTKEAFLIVTVRESCAFVREPLQSIWKNITEQEELAW